LEKGAKVVIGDFCDGLVGKHKNCLPGNPEEVAQVVGFLVENDFVTDTILHVYTAIKDHKLKERFIMGIYTDKVVLITGAAGGIGIATAKAFAEQGAKLALVDLNKEALEKAVKEAGIEDALLLTANVTKEEEVQKYVEDTVAKYGKIDSFVNNAGINGDFANIVDQTVANFKNVLDVNVIGVFLGLKHVMKVMIQQKQGSIVNLASNGGLLGAPGMSSYVASKHAVIALNKTAALEGAEHGIRSVAVCPSGVDTQMMRSIEKNAMPGQEEEAKKAFAATVPLNRYAEASEIADLITFLASDKASFISGSYYRIDGGQGATSV